MIEDLDQLFPDVKRKFIVNYKVFSLTKFPGKLNENAEIGNKIIMPAVAYYDLRFLNVDYPMLFKIINQKQNKISHVEILDFSADKGECYLPEWIMNMLLLEEGDILTIENVCLPVATFSKFQSHSIDFGNIAKPKKVVKNVLRHLSCLTVGDTIPIMHKNQIYNICVIETQPFNAVYIKDSNIGVDFEAPVGDIEATCMDICDEIIPDHDLVEDENIEEVTHQKDVQDGADYGLKKE